MVRQKIGLRIKEIRIKKLKISQSELSNRIGWDRTFLSRVESGKQNLTIDNLYLICLNMGVSFKEFFSDFESINLDEEDSESIIKKNNGGHVQ